MKVVSLQVGTVATHEYQGKPVETACFKRPVEGPLHLGPEGFTGDQVGDRVNHGGPDKATLVYAAEHYAHWERFLGRAPGPAVLGENLTVEGATEENVCIGDTYRVGGAVVQIAQPRVPCYKMNLKHGSTDVLPEIVRTGFGGFYLRVLQPGTVQVGDRFTLMSRPEGAPTVAWANRIFHHERQNVEGMRRLMQAEGLAAVWVNAMERRLG